MKDEFSLERIVPDLMDKRNDFDRTSLNLHRDRYAFAIENGIPGRLLDIACGTGYGSYQILSSEKFSDSQISAVDISEESITYARERYAHSGLEFICSDAMEYNSPDLFDTIVCLETIEHLKDPGSFIKKMYSQLKKNGILIASAPVTLSTDGNPYHLTDFTPSGFKKLFDPNFFIFESSLSQEQPYSPGGLFKPENKRLENTRPHLLRYYLHHPKIFFKRIWTLAIHGFKNKYLTLALKKI